jgi:endoglucanase Acf2
MTNIEVTNYNDDMLNYRYFINSHRVVTITTKTWIELQNQCEILLNDNNCKTDECEREYWASVVRGEVPANVRIIRPSPMTKIR